MPRRPSVPAYCKHAPADKLTVGCRAPTANAKWCTWAYTTLPRAAKRYNQVIAEYLANREADSPATTNDKPRADMSIAEVMVPYLRMVQKHYTKNGKPTSEQAAIKAGAPQAE